jgi:putative ABC transport system ATP-binding protein
LVGICQTSGSIFVPRREKIMSPCQATVILETRNLTREIKKNGHHIKAIDDISYIFNKGCIYNIVGPSGAGKSSFLRLLNRLDDPIEGEVLFYGQPIMSYPPTVLRKKVAMLFQTPFLFPGTVKDNLEYCRAQCSGDIIESNLSRVGLKPEFIEMDAESLSVGEKQRVAIARSLIFEPEVLLLDEPTSALDPASSKKIEELILTLSIELCLTVIIVTHQPAQALRLGGETLLLVKGRLIEAGETLEVLTEPKTESARKYINKELT